MDGANATLKRRWMIRGRLMTIGPLHIGSGITENDPRITKKKSQEQVGVAKVAKNAAGEPYIPGSTLKGNLRTFARDSGQAVGFVESIFGTLDPKETGSKGGRADFFDAPSTPGQSVTLAHDPPYWDRDQLTGIMTSTQINRRTRTVADGKLFHTEYVPAGVSFDVRIGGQDINSENWEDDVKGLLAVLDGFNSGGVSLGAESGNEWGRCKWEPVEIRIFDENTAKNWVANGCKVGWDALEPIGSDMMARLAAEAESSPTANATSLKIEITLNFEGSFLVDDPFRSRKDDKRKNEPRDPNGPADHEPLLDSDGKLWLPSRSFRGAFRSQAERILRTIGGDAAACYPDGKGPRRTCKAIADAGDVPNLCPACQVFGATGWRSPLEITNFKPRTDEDVGRILKQDFVAIDRFTGGASHGAKFDARSYYRPRLSGSVLLNDNLLQKTGNGDALRGLLALTLRDLKEGDIRFGFGAAKGYGACTASVMTDLSVTPASIEALHELCRRVKEKYEKESPNALS